MFEDRLDLVQLEKAGSQLHLDLLYFGAATSKRRIAAIVHLSIISTTFVIHLGFTFANPDNGIGPKDHPDTRLVSPSRNVGPRASCLDYPRLEAKDLQTSETADPVRAETLFERGQRLLRGADYAAAREVFEAALEIDPSLALAHLGKAEAHLHTDADADAMLFHLASAITIRPDNPRAHSLLGSVLADIGERRLAEIHLECALNLRSELHETRYRLAVVQLAAGRLERAEYTLRDLLAREGPESRTHVLLGRVYEAMGRFEEAASAVERAANGAGQNPALLRRAATLYRRAGLWDRAEQLKAQADAIDPPPAQRDLRPLRRR
ncbi:MAG: tetratricopeptide repeat protein [Myxococcota bacterium]